MSETARKPLVLGDKNYQDVSNDICKPVEAFPDKQWFALFFSAKALFLLYLTIIGIVIGTGMGLLGVNRPMAWGTMIVVGPQPGGVVDMILPYQ